jgi:hypothetical protein
MKQKYSILIDDAKKELIIKEYAELDKEILSLLCEETYDANEIKVDIEKGKEVLIGKLRTRNMYPPYIFAGRIADAVISLFNPDGPSSAELFFDDKESFIKLPTEELMVEADEIDEESETIDDLLEDEIDKFGDKKVIKTIKTSIKIAEDEPIDSEELS